MTRVMVGEHLVVNLSRRSLCDNCIADVCAVDKTGRMVQCKNYKSPFVALRRCRLCGQIFDVFSNFDSLDYDSCPDCNKALRDK
jgi:hypothetical protein